MAPNSQPMHYQKRLITAYKSVIVLSLGILFQGKCVFSQMNCTGGIDSFLDSFQSIFEKKPFRPVLTYDHPTHVNISFSLYAVLGVNEKVQILTTFLWFVMYWENEFIGWDPNECDGASQISLSTENVWLPDILINEFMDEDTSPKTPYLYVNYEGRIRYEKPMRVVSSCSLDIFNFPFDMQNCTLTFSAYLHTAADITLGLAKSAQEISDVSKTVIQTKGEWQLCGITAEEMKMELGKDYYSEIVFHVAIKRRPIQYVVNLLVPSAFLMLIDVMSFYLPPHTVDRAAFKMTLILGYTVFLLMMNDLLPATASGVPLISTYFSLCLALMVISLLETVAITHILHCGSTKYPAVPQWVKKLVLHHIAKVLCWKHQEPSDFTSRDGDVTIIMNTGAQGNNGINTSRNIKTQKPSACWNPSLLQPVLKNIAEDVGGIQKHFINQQQEKDVEEEWLEIGSVLDMLLFRIYLCFVTVFTVVIVSLWFAWYNM